MNRLKKTSVILAAMLLSACQAYQIDEADYYRQMSNQPIGTYWHPRINSGPYAYGKVTVRNNSGKFLQGVGVEIHAYNGNVRIGSGIAMFGSVSPGEEMEQETFIITNGKKYTSWKIFYSAH